MKRNYIVSVTVMLVIYAMTSAFDQAIAVSITHSNTTVNMDFVTIGNPGNPADSTGYGAVDYQYQIGTKEVSINQFMTAYGADNRVGSGDEDEWFSSEGGVAPAVLVSFYESMKYANWLTSGDAYDGAYQFNSSGTLTAVDRDAAVTTYGTVFVVPSEDEWYKAAYYRPVNDGTYSRYPNGSDDQSDLIQGAPNGWNYYDGDFANGNRPWVTGSGALEQNGTYDMMGNVWEMNESAFDGVLDVMAENRVVRGGAYGINGLTSQDSSNRYSRSPTTTGVARGFRIAVLSAEPADIPFSAFAPTVMEVHFGDEDRTDSFFFHGHMTLGESSDGIDPFNEEITVLAGPLELVIPSGSLQVSGTASMWRGEINGARVKVVLRDLGEGRHTFFIHAHGTDLSGWSNPEEWGLTIGNDTGSATEWLKGHLQKNR